MAESSWAAPLAGVGDLPSRPLPVPHGQQRPAPARRSLPSYTQQLLRRLRLKLANAAPGKETLDLSVVICTYNGEHRLPKVLDCLLAQLGTEHLAWEVVVVDNNSTDGTAQVVKAYQQRWPQDIPLRYAFEARQGAGYARQQAIHIARSPLVGFLDDDNHPALGWVVAAHRFGQVHPQAGAYGSRIRGDFETAPPPNFERIGAMLALTERGPAPLRYAPEQKVLPPAAGLVVRRQAWLSSVPEQLTLADAIGFRAAGEDLEVVLHMQRQGWEVWYNPAMRMQHEIPASRFERDYLLRMFRSIGLSRHRTRMLSVPLWQRPLMAPAYLANDMRKILRHLVKHQGEVVSDTVTACEMTLYLYSLLSPFYITQRLWRQRWARRICKF
ncbi:hormogonium polysaccharide biosynthesis glycosyltransferase HpsE [Nodosilinea sp. PGN35]|uniref:hormogonium polysaccharide biosynthesis glycosyltransferase HpsE n=1 Tax=Nodosilinea sp. PGN35 TaxID=3020489 RepID=UPI0023B23209|nr:hormogonium polysaccharide biosynthesis glycosyltransferase HpsE [Nodosilinea sp. TSF1-S3]MDF0366709.1 hormogonium polysaccharide biosynthesis glycosyltransferase HpsE [Nodosilinea sp. TSF1-S3]